MIREYLILHTAALLLGILLDTLIGDPHSMPHPIRALGSLINTSEKILYRMTSPGQQIIAGAILWIEVIAITLTVSFLIFSGAYHINKYVGAIVESVMVFYILAARSLKDESMKVYNALSSEDIICARVSLSMIVGRDTSHLDEASVARAAVETVAENTSDGVVAPLLYAAIFGPVGGMIYKAVNTMDSMLGYRNERYLYFGRVAARADDVFNYIPSRLCALLMIAASTFCRLSGKDALRTWRRDRCAHKSPNSAQTESVCAGALGIRLGGASTYGGIMVEKPYIGDDTRPVEANDIKQSIRLMFATEALCTAVVLLILTILILISR